MSIGVDLKEAIATVGVTIRIVESSSPSEYIRFKPNKQVTKPFIREYFLETMMSYDTAIVSGDIIEVGVTGHRYIMMNKTPDLFENEVMRYGGVAYKTNVNGSLQRPEYSRSANLQKMETFVTIPGAITVDALMVEALYGHSLDTDETLGELGLEKHELYIPHKFGAKVKDRFYIDEDHYYRVITVKTHRYDDVDVLEIDVDTRPNAYPIDTTLAFVVGGPVN
jgi:hypothetical protein